MSDKGPADELRSRLRPIADNPMAALWLARMDLSDDPDAVALELLEYFGQVVRRVGQVIAPFAKQMVELYALGGAVEAEFHANDGAA